MGGVDGWATGEPGPLTLGSAHRFFVFSPQMLKMLFINLLFHRVTVEKPYIYIGGPYLFLEFKSSGANPAVVYLPHGILCSSKKEGTLTLFDSMDGPESIMLSKVSQSEKDKYHMVSLIRGI